MLDKKVCKTFLVVDESSVFETTSIPVCNIELHLESLYKA